jgi:hypothetical protein
MEGKEGNNQGELDDKVCAIAGEELTGDLL